jgi:molybdate transport system ATP-binding protein
MIEASLRHNFSTKDGGFHINVNIAAEARCLAFYGPSGSGKTLTLHTIAGLFTPREGFVRINGRTLLDTAHGVNVPARKRHLGYLFQDYALFPHMTVRQNIGFSLAHSLLPLKKQAANTRIDEMLASFEIENLANQRPQFISGGQRQRVALARALAAQPDMLLLDEPFSALDPDLRSRVREQCLEWLDRFSIPAVIITHDYMDVTALADAVIPYKKGKNGECISVSEFSRNNGNQAASKEN